jgi:hypothetical protein
MVAGDASTFFAEFTIKSGAAAVTGTKKYVVGTASCQPVFVTDPVKSTTWIAEFELVAQYDAKILIEKDTFADAGTSTVSGVIRWNEESGVSEVKLNETFVSGKGHLLSLTPVADTNEVGTTHTITAQVVTLGGPTGGVTVRFVVTGSVTTTGSCTTNKEGSCTFTYDGPDFPGADAIHAYVDSDNDGMQDVGEAFADAAKAWILPVTTPGQVTGGGQTMSGAIIHGVTFGFNAHSDGENTKGHCNVLDHASNINIRCLDVTALVQVGQHATFFGNALVDGVPTEYRIDVNDVDEPGAYLDMFLIQTREGYSAGGVVTNGNIQVHTRP